MPGKRKPDWEAIRAEYLRGGTSYRQLAAAHGVPESTLTRRAIRESWADQRQRIASDVTAAVHVRVTEQATDDAMTVVRQHFDDWETLRREVMGQAIGADARTLRDLTSAYRWVSEGQRLARGLAAPKADDESKTQPGDGQPPAVLILPAKSKLPPRPEEATDDLRGGLDGS